jgi:arsenite transporter
MGIFERLLTLWVGLCIIAGVLLSNSMPQAFQYFAAMEIARVNIPVALLIWVMIYPMMIQVDFSSIRNVGKKPKGLVLTLVINWLVKPFTMAALGWLFFRVIFADLVESQTASEYIAGMILLGMAPCTAMVFVWSQLTKGDPNYTLVQVSVNDVNVPWNTLLLSVALYVLIPLVAGVVTHKMLDARNNHTQLNHFIHRLKPFSATGLLATVVGVLVEVPVMLSLVAFANRTKH